MDVISFTVPEFKASLEIALQPMRMLVKSMGRDIEEFMNKMNETNAEPAAREAGPSSQDFRCYRCHQLGHVARNCWQRRRQDSQDYLTETVAPRR